ncbi:hypothetical protein BJ508DRAFT_157065 [Ascobolus immersus RN42]|uniref:Uncharacterized protein n=1 Tax=Ascobolus immersus RN42 TaxID=1160509 RepID=A0A3N4HWU5_ASCIM|nr:hypothetical protein BJ508DRAFT_157065 [Ascobolus immersus RN42]
MCSISSVSVSGDLLLGFRVSCSFFRHSWASSKYSSFTLCVGSSFRFIMLFGIYILRVFWDLFGSTGWDSV